MEILAGQPKQSETTEVEQAFPEVEVTSEKYRSLTGEDLAATLDISTWDTGVKALQAYERLEREIEIADQASSEFRQAIRDRVFSLLPNMPGAPAEVGVRRATIGQLKEVQRNVLFNGLVEACDGNSNVFYTLPIQIIQIAVATITYFGDESMWANRIFRRDIPMKGGADILQETIDLLSRRADGARKGGRRGVTEMMRRAVMTYMERLVLADKAGAPWRMGHGHPLAYELLTGGGIAQLVGHSVDVLRRLVLEHKKFVYIASETNAEHITTIGDALMPLEYAILQTAEPYVSNVLGGHYTGEWADMKANKLEPFCREAAPVILTGVYRASAMAPPHIFYAHKDHVHEAALIAMADSVMQEHRGWPMLIDMADGLCRTYFGAETLNRPIQSAFAQFGEPYRYLDERATRR